MNPNQNAVAEPEKPLPHAQSACPVCGERLILLRNFYRCTRCCYSICESCEPESDDAE